MKKFEMLERRLQEAAENEKKEYSFFIENGYFPKWGEEHRTNSDNGLKRESTPAKWELYTAGKITREKAVEIAITRACKRIDKDTAAKLAKLERIAAAPDLDFISISVDWVRSRTWGYNPRVEITTNAGRFTGSASGCGYDKESTAVGEALNQCDSVLKALYTLKENNLRAGQSDFSKSACTGVDNRNICGYGSGYSILPYFEGGVGVSCFWSILKNCGFNTTGHHTKHSDFYSVVKKED